VGRHLNRAKRYFGTDTRGMLEGGHYSLLHTRSLEFDDLRPYVPGDEIRDIDWRATARAGSVLVKRFVTEKHHKILLVADAGRNMSALTPSGEVKRDVAAVAMGAVGLIALRRTDEVGMVYGDTRGSQHMRSGRGEPHIEGLIEQYYGHSRGDVGTSDIGCQLEYVARHHRRPLLLVVVSDEPDVSPQLGEALRRLAGLHDLLWLMISDMPAVGAPGGEHDGVDVATGRVVPDGNTLGPRVVAAYRKAERRRTARLDEQMTTRGVPFARIEGSADVRPKLVALTEAYRRAG
jgi:uncharacterized protein (DUF58 family)